MRTVDVLRGLTPLLLAVALLLIGTRRRAVRAFESTRAFSADRAIVPEPTRVPLIRWWRSRLERYAVLRRCADGRVWLDQEAWRVYRRTRQRRGVLVALVLLTALALAVGLRLIEL